MRQKIRILIYILIAIAAVIMVTLTILNSRQADKPVSAQEHIDLGRIYLTELSYEKAVLEFTEAIEIEPLNAGAYLGLAEAYSGMGDTEKAIEILEDGYGMTGDERIKDMLEELMTSEVEETETYTTIPQNEKEITEISKISQINEDTVECIDNFIIINGVKYSTSLTELKLVDMNLTDDSIQDLNKMVNLWSLDISDNQITNIDILKNMTKLESINVSGNPIKNIDILSEISYEYIDNYSGFLLIYVDEKQIKDIEELTWLNNSQLTVYTNKNNKNQYKTYNYMNGHLRTVYQFDEHNLIEQINYYENGKIELISNDEQITYYNEDGSIRDIINLN